MSTVKSKLLDQFKRNYPNFYKKDLDKLADIIFNEIKKSLKRSESVEIRGWGSLKVKLQKKSIRRNPKTGDLVEVPEKKNILWKMSKEVFKKLNDD
ncbi:HU family DNA-binding protein [Candidatus Pelagibacter sp.]|uniref:HU family DNA-binding protein n=1 Tax=Candidatus Pelagibacter sp. TaxID=2024849 RepID=UPI003F872B08